ncbi:MAG: hypothetical protein GC160_23225 [Acidobacteria bacterium]|nr:hypothetical protein [Acidobacteriota bacterium]
MRRLLLLGGLLVLTMNAAGQGPAVATGPAVGERIPSISAVDQDGRERDFDSLKGPNGLLLLFHRSADW